MDSQLTLRALERPAADEPEGALVLLHGRGADEYDLLPLFDVLDPERRLLGVSPRGPLSLSPGGAHWYIVPRVGFPDPDTFAASYRLASEWVDSLPHPPEKTILGGFSQGAVMSYALGLGSDRPRPAAITAFSGFIPSGERIVTVEDSAELQLRQDHVIRLESRPPNVEGKGAIEIRDLVRNALRMRPDRIIVGECRGGEALDMLQAMNTGHEGSMSTVHANSPYDAFGRLETMVLMGGADLPARAIQKQIASAIDIVVQAERVRGGARKIVSIAEVTGLVNGETQFQELFQFRQTGVDPEGNAVGMHTAAGKPSIHLDHFVERGESVPLAIFEPSGAGTLR